VPEVSAIVQNASIHSFHHILSYSNKSFFLFMHAVASENLSFSPAQYTNTRPFSTLVSGQLHEVLLCLTGQGQPAHTTNYSSTNPY
jgi:hypothetical protein